MKTIVKIPEKRVAVLIGKDGKTLKMLQEETGVSLDLENNAVEIDGEPLKTLDAKNVVTAIGRGFSPEKALNLLNDNYYLDIVDISPYGNNLERIKGRVIGTKGKTREKIESETNTFVSVYGKTIGIIGTYEDVDNARRAIDMLLEGRHHATVYKYLETL